MDNEELSDIEPLLKSYVRLVKNEVERSILYNGWPEDVDSYSVYEKKVMLPVVPSGILKIPTDFRV